MVIVFVDLIHPQDPLNDIDGDGICANDEILGCTNPSACLISMLQKSGHVFLQLAVITVLEQLMVPDML